MKNKIGIFLIALKNKIASIIVLSFLLISIFGTIVFNYSGLKETAFYKSIREEVVRTATDIIVKEVLIELTAELDNGEITKDILEHVDITKEVLEKFSNVNDKSLEDDLRSKLYIEEKERIRKEEEEWEEDEEESDY